MTKIDREHYIKKVQMGIALYAAMDCLKDNEELPIEFGATYLEIHCSIWDDRKSFSIGDGKLFGRRMNIDMEKSSKVNLVAFTYDLFNNKTTQKIGFEHITVVEKQDNKF